MPAMPVSVVLSIIAIVLSITSLAWQVASWKLSGPVVKVTAAQTLPVYGQSVGDWHVAVSAHNSGRAPVTVTGWGLRLPDRQTIAMIQNLPWSAALPTAWRPAPAAIGTSPQRMSGGHVRQMASDTRT
jgi:hypothetical protein